MTGGMARGVNVGTDGGAESYRLLTHSEPPSGSLVTGSIGAENCDEVRIALAMEVGLWAAALNLVVRRFCGCDCTEMVQRQSCGTRARLRTRSIACGKKKTRFAEANRVLERPKRQPSCLS